MNEINRKVQKHRHFRQQNRLVDVKLKLSALRIVVANEDEVVQNRVEVVEDLGSCDVVLFEDQIGASGRKAPKAIANLNGAHRINATCRSRTID